MASNPLRIKIFKKGPIQIAAIRWYRALEKDLKSLALRLFIPGNIPKTGITQRSVSKDIGLKKYRLRGKNGKKCIFVVQKSRRDFSKVG